MKSDSIAMLAARAPAWVVILGMSEGDHACPDQQLLSRESFQALKRERKLQVGAMQA
jgi:hypothetical protein